MKHQLPRLCIVWPGYRQYNRHFFELLANDKRYTIRVNWIINYHTDDPPSPRFNELVPSRIVGARSIRVSGYNYKSFARLISFLWEDISWADCVLTSTQAPVHSKLAYLLAKLKRTPIFLVTEQWKRVPGKSLLYRLYENIGYRMMRNCDTLFVHGENQKQFAIVNGVRENKIRILPFLSEDLQLQYTSNDELRQTLGLKKELILLYFGRIIPKKGLKDLLQAYKQVAAKDLNAVLIICGGADPYFKDYDENVAYESECRALADTIKQGRVIFTGPISPQDRKPYFDLADIFIHPHSNLGDLTEGWGLVLNEAASLSLPIITTDRVGSAANLVVDGKNGFIIPAGNIRILTEKIIELLEDKDKLAIFSRNSRLVFEQYHQPERIKDLVWEAVNGKYNQ